MIKRILVFILLITCIASCHSQSEKEETSSINIKGQIDNFWNWFQSNEKNLRDFQKNPDEYISPIQEQLSKIKEGIAVEFEPPKDNKITVTISADGDISLFPVVQKIVEKAPKIKGWDFVAFRQRTPQNKLKGIVLKVNGYEFSPDTMKFASIIVGDSLDIIVYTTNVTEDNFNQVAYGGLLLIDNILGEYDCVTKVRNFDFQNLPTTQTELKGLKPLLELSDYVDKFHKRTKKD